MVRRRRAVSVCEVVLVGLVLGCAHLSCAAESWVDWRVSGPFIFRAEFSLEGWEPLMDEIAQLQRDLAAWIEVPPGQEAVEIYLFRDKQSYSRYLQENLANVPYRRALYVKNQGPGRVYTYHSRDLATDLRHECTHALLHAALPMVPLWLDEGLAEYFEVPPQQRAFDNPHLSAVRWNLALGMSPRLEKLEKKGDLSEMGRGEYRAAWAWIHFMLHGPKEARAELIRFLGDIHASTPPGLLSERLERAMPQSERRLAAHFKNWRRGC